MAPKAKKEAPVSAEEPAAKKAKEEGEKVEEKVEVPKFEEPDAAKDSRPALKETVEFATDDTTLNVVPTLSGKLLTSLSDGGMAFLIAGARANVGQKAGRYMFEVKLTHTIATGNTGSQKPKPLIRVGFSTASGSLFFGEDDQSCCFDGEGFFMSDKTKRVHGSGKSSGKGGAGPDQRFGKEQIVAVVLNLDDKSPNNNTVALYRDGALISEPKPVPENLQGKPLFPHICFRNVGVHVNFGTTPLKELPFKCRMIQGAAASDVTVAPSTAPKDGKYEVVVPVAFPDEGTFDWLDTFMSKHPKYVELSDRKVIEWAKNSGLWSKGGMKSSNDKPAFSYGVPSMDDFSVRRVLSSIAPLVPRNYVVMEVKSNLLANERKELVKKFNYPCYKKVAHVVMGKPNDEFKDIVQSKILKDKQAKSDQAWKLKKAEKERKKQLAAAAKQREADLKKQRAEAAERRTKAKEAAEKAAKEKAEKAKAEDKAAAEKEAAEKKEKEAEEAPEKKDGEEAKEGEAKVDVPMEGKKEEEVKAEEVKAEEVKTEEPKAEEAVKEEKEEEDDDMGTEPPQVELTEDEKAVNFLQKPLPDLTAMVLSANYGNFSTPESDEGFDKINYEWEKGDAAKSYLKSWVLNKKLTTRLEDLKPGAEFKEKQAEFEKALKEWQAKVPAGQAKAAKKADDEEEIDIDSVTDICDAGKGVPLFDSFVYEDWVLVQLRFELALLVHSFKKDADDPDRVGVPMDHIGFYFHKYYGRSLDCKRLGMSELKEVFAMVKDSVELKDKLITATEELDGLDIFVKRTEEQRRKRQQRIEAGDETARLKFAPPEEIRKPEVVRPVEGKGKGKDKGKDKGDDKGAGKDKDKSAAEKGYGTKDKGESKGDSKGWGKDKAAPEPKGWGKDDKGRDDKGKGGDKGWGKAAEDKGYGKQPEKGGDKGWGKSDDKGAGKGDDKGWGKPAEEKGWGKSSDKGWGKPEEKGAWGKGDDKGWGGKGSDDKGKGGDKGWGKPAEDKGWGKAAEKGADKGWGKSDDKGWGKPAEEKGWGKAAEKGGDKGWGGKGDDKGRGKAAEEPRGNSWGGNDSGNSWGGNDNKSWNQGGNDNKSWNQGGGGGDDWGNKGSWGAASPQVIPAKGHGKGPYDNMAP